jgi:hypothetical protein
VQATSSDLLSSASPLDALTLENQARATAAEAAVAAGQPAKWLVSYNTDVLDQQVQSTSALLVDLPPVRAASVARQQVFAAVKASVLGAAQQQPVQPAASLVTTEGGAATTTAAAAQGPTLQLVADYSHLPLSLVSISSPEELARLRANPLVTSVTANGVVRTMAMAGLSMIGQPAVLERGYVGAGTVVTVDTGLDYTRPAFGPCTAPGLPADNCKVLFVKDIGIEDNRLDDPVQPHGTNVAGIIAGGC